jgi:lysosomal Pro-X carboxypeptidase
MWWPATTWNLTADMEACQQQFGVQLRPHWAIAEFGGLDFHASSNIIFSQGLLDPWHTSGVTSSQVWPPRPARRAARHRCLSELRSRTFQGPTLYSVIVPESGHHLDLRGPHKEDPDYVRAARETEASIIEGWLNDYWRAKRGA